MTAGKDVRKPAAERIIRPNNRLALKPIEQELDDGNFDSVPFEIQPTEIEAVSTSKPRRTPIPVHREPEPTFMTSPLPTPTQAAPIQPSSTPASMTPEIFTNFMMRFLGVSGDQGISQMGQLTPAPTPATPAPATPAPAISAPSPGNEDTLLQTQKPSGNYFFC